MFSQKPPRASKRGGMLFSLLGGVLGRNRARIKGGIYSHTNPEGPIREIKVDKVGKKPPKWREMELQRRHDLSK